MNRVSAIIPVIIIAAAPLSGIHLAGHSILPYLEFPPKPVVTSHAPFSAAVFAGIAIFSLLFILPFILKSLAYQPVRERAGRKSMPWWGYVSFLSLGCFWMLAWNRFNWFSAFQAHTFFPLWLSWIISVNALIYRVEKSCPLTRSPRKFFSLFIFSAFFWWMFEYLNRFVGNWYYSGSRYPALTYFVLATLSFSTVLPAVESMKEYLLTFRRFRHAFKEMPAIHFVNSHPAAGSLIVVSSVLLGMIGIFPDVLFPLIWICPFFIFFGYRVLSGRPHIFSSVAEGDYTPVAAYASAAVACGFFWEMFNYYSLARWQYSIPYVEKFYLFEMPVLGYAGYLPFGLECALIIDLITGRR